MTTYFKIDVAISLPATDMADALDWVNLIVKEAQYNNPTVKFTVSVPTTPSSESDLFADQSG